MLSIRIRAYELEVELQTSETYPDALTDLVNRASQAFVLGVTALKNNNIDLFNITHNGDSEDD